MTRLDFFACAQPSQAQATCMPQLALSASSAAFFALLAPAEAQASAWIAPSEGQEIWTNVAGQRGGLEFVETSAYWEIPVGETTSVVATPWVEQAVDSSDEGWRAEATLGVKREILSTDHSAMALQAGAVWTSDPADKCDEGAAEFRWLAGVSLGERGRGFLNLETAARAGESGCGGGRFELTAGYKPSQHWLTMAQLFTDEPRQGDTALKLQLTLVHIGDNRKGVQLGLRARLDSDDHEPALVLAFWGKPGDH